MHSSFDILTQIHGLVYRKLPQISFLVDCLDNKILYNIKLAFRENE